MTTIWDLEEPPALQVSPPSQQDAECIALIAAMTMEDVEQVQSSRKGKEKHSVSVTDEELAFQLYAQEAAGLLACSNDAAFARSISDALTADQALLLELAAAEATATRDREMALAMSEGRPMPPRPASPTVSTGNEIFFQLLSTQPTYQSKDISAKASSSRVVSSFASSSSVLLPKKNRNMCVFCREDIKGVEILVTCGHYYDLDCLVSVFQHAAADEGLYPARCCNIPFVFDELRRYLSVRLATLYEKVSLEFSTIDRVYCHGATCSTFLGPATEAQSSVCCLKCGDSTCSRCKNAAHTLAPCASQLDAPVLALAEQEGWKRCPGCHRLVELTQGCYHMTCRCKKQFCYVCTAVWKTCTCPQWEEHRLLDAAQDRVNRQLREELPAPSGRPVAPVLPGFNVRVAQEVDRLRVNHECHHISWGYRAGAGRCESCNYLLPQFLLQCRGCQILACVRCRRNRL